MIPSLETAGARLFVIASDGMADLRPGRHAVAVRPVTTYEGEGMYATRDGVVRLCDVGEGGLIRAYGTHPPYQRHMARLTKEEFADAFPYKVTATIAFLEANLWPAVQQAREAA